jgi:predicted amidohydrolase
MTVTSPIYQEVYYFLASAPTHEQILAFRPSEATQDRIRALLTANREGRLTMDEQAELDEFEQVEHLVRMLKLHTQHLVDQS